MQFLYAVDSTRVLGTDTNNDTIVGFLFQPTAILIDLGNKETLEDGTEVVSVTTTLSQGIQGGYRQEVQTQQLPASILSAITGFDVDTMKPLINEEALGQILASFDLALK